MNEKRKVTKMIFNVPGHIDMIRNGLKKHPPIPHIPPRFYVKTQTRRVNRGIYQKGKDYAVQPKRGAKAEEDIQIVIDNIWKEQRKCVSISAPNIKISVFDALAEGGYQPAEYELEFRRAYPNWDGEERWAYLFHAIEVHR